MAHMGGKTKNHKCTQTVQASCSEIWHKMLSKLFGSGLGAAVEYLLVSFCLLCLKQKEKIIHPEACLLFRVFPIIVFIHAISTMLFELIILVWNLVITLVLHPCSIAVRILGNWNAHAENPKSHLASDFWVDHVWHRQCTKELLIPVA